MTDDPTLGILGYSLSWKLIEFEGVKAQHLQSIDRIFKSQ